MLIVPNMLLASEDINRKTERTLLVHQQQHEQQIQNLTAAKESQERQTELLQRRCEALEHNFRGIKKTKSNKACRKLITGDSNLKNVARRRIDSTGNTHVRTFRGATVAQLTNIISTGACYYQVEQVVVAIGTNDCTVLID